MNNFIEMFTEQCNLLYQSMDEVSKKNVKSHNQAMKKIVHISNKLIEADRSLAEKNFLILLENDSRCIRLVAAGQCLNHALLQEKAVATLKTLKNDSQSFHFNTSRYYAVCLE